MGLVVWSVAFNLGAFGVVFFKDVFAVVVTATVALLVSFVVPEVFAGPLWAVRLLLAGSMAHRRRDDRPFSDGGGHRPGPRPHRTVRGTGSHPLPSG